MAPRKVDSGIRTLTARPTVFWAAAAETDEMWVLKKLRFVTYAYNTLSSI